MSDKLLNLAAKYALKKISPNFVKALKEYYGDNFDVFLRYPGNFEDYVTSNIDLSKLDSVVAIVHYPELTIKNYHGNKHVIRDVYIKYITRDNGTFYFEMARTTFTLEELKRGYIFSHTPSTSSYVNKGFSRSCLGSGPLNNFTPSLIDSTVEEFKFYFQLVTDYLQWESIGGVPYIRFSTIKPKVTNTTTISSLSVKKFLSNPPIGIRVRVTNDCIEVDYTEEFELSLAEFLRRNGFGSILAYKVDDEYFSYTENILTLSENEINRLNDTLNKELFYYKGEYLKTKLYDGVSIEPTGNLYPIPSVTKQVCNTLSENLTRAYIMSCGSIEKKDTAENTQSSYQEDSILV